MPSARTPIGARPLSSVHCCNRRLRCCDCICCPGGRPGHQLTQRYALMVNRGALAEGERTCMPGQATVRLVSVVFPGSALADALETEQSAVLTSEMGEAKHGASALDVRH